MDKQTAKIYVQFGIDSTKFSKKPIFSFMLLNIIVFSVSLALYNPVYFIVVVACFVFLLILLTICTTVKWTPISGLFAQVTQLLFFVISLNCIHLGMYKISNLFLWYDYMISILIQTMSLVISTILVLIFAKKYDSKKKPRVNTIAGTVAGFSCASGTILCKIFLKDASLSVVLSIMSVLINLIICLLNFVIIMGVYRIYLIRKFRLNKELILPNAEAKEKTNG